MNKQIFRAPDDLRLGAIALRVRDLEPMCDFYSNFLGLDLLHQEADRVDLGFEPEQPLVSLSARPNGSQRPGNMSGLYHFALLVSRRDRLAHALKQLLHSGYPLQGFADHFVSEAIYLTDPEGNGIEIYADRPRATWRWDGDQLRIGTAPLDIDALIGLAQEGDDQPILSEGAVLGHMHLQVSSLPEAMRFYESLLGFDSMGKYGDSAAFYAAGGYHHHIGLNTWASADGPNASSQMLGLDHFEIIYRETLQLEAFVEALVSSGLPYDRNDQGVWLEDPSSNRIKIRAER